MNSDTELGSKWPGGPNPRRVAAGRANRAKRAGLTEAGRERLRAAAVAAAPWRFATGPRTAAGKRRAAANGKVRQSGPTSVREARAAGAAVREFLAAAKAARSRAAATGDGRAGP